MDGTAQPTRRNRLKGTIFLAGYDSIKEFAEIVGMKQVDVSAILGGREFPTPATQRKIAEALTLSLKELRSLI